ncbi:hypothetical protein [Methylogaea oryzae]|uniref:hypothetical protein n=1 Tax=Methylogaea oryzae TaxID=1295382 RepID=UPI00138F0A0A|nr:hypothetical protein [Methylogaea oryzae]
MARNFFLADTGQRQNLNGERWGLGFFAEIGAAVIGGLFVSLVATLGERRTLFGGQFA